jgi:branched-chain amino acid transport system substrate-binding protein
MTTTRRTVLLGASAAGLSLPFIRPASAQSAEPIRIGWLAALTGASSAPGIGFNRGVVFAADELNAKGGVKGRPIEIVTRDTQGDPTKAVNATQELISRVKVNAMWGPTNSGESLATTPIMARAKMPNIHPCVVDSLIDPAKYPAAFRMAPSNAQWDDAARSYLTKVLKIKDIAVFGDTTGYGVAAVAASVAAIGTEGAHVASQAQIDANQPDVTPDMIRARDAGAKAILVWSVSVGLLSRLMNARATLGWNVPIAGHPSLGSGDIRNLIEKPGNWDNVYAVGYRSCSFDGAGNLPPRSAAFVKRLAGKVDLSDSALWWVACGYDAVNLVAAAVEHTGQSTSDAIVGYWNSLKKYPGIFGDYTYSAADHNGYPQDDVVMSRANSQKDGAFALAPGYV